MFLFVKKLTNNQTISVVIIHIIYIMLLFLLYVLFKGPIGEGSYGRKSISRITGARKKRP